MAASLSPPSARAAVAVLLVAAALPACPPKETTISYDVPVRPPSDPKAGALVDDPAPPDAAYDATLDYQGAYGSENRSAMRFRFDVADYQDAAERAAAEKLYPSHAAAMAAHRGAIPSVQTVGTYAKQLDDTILAGVERAVASGVEPALPPERALLEGTLAWLASRRHEAGGGGPDGDAAIVYLAGALRVAGASGPGDAPPADLEPRVADAVGRFEMQPAVSKPIGFYSWSDDLRRAWKVERWLQQSLPGTQACALARAIAADPARVKQYTALVALVSRLTNPPSSTLAPLIATAAGAACTSEARPFIGPSGSAEVALYARLYPNGVPPDVDLMHELVEAIRSGRLDLTPKPDDGWYQHQAWALETLLVTDKADERAKVAFTARYKKRLVEAFSTMLVQHRETHVASLGEAAGAAAPSPRPTFRVEPLATVYARHARSYAFLEKALDQALGPALLDQGVAVAQGGPEKETLRARVRRARDLFWGLYFASCQDLGMHPKLDQEGDPAQADGAALAAAATKWAAELANDPVAGADVRVMVPIAALSPTRAKYWVVVGVRTTLAAYSYLHGASNVPPDPGEEVRVPLPTEQLVEVTSSATPLTREELRALCDQKQTAAAIRAALEAR